MDAKEVEKTVCEFERKYGTAALLKMALGGLNMLLVKKGLVTEDEIRESIIERMEEEKELLSESEKEQQKEQKEQKEQETDDKEDQCCGSCGCDDCKATSGADFKRTKGTNSTGAGSRNNW